MPMRTRGTVRNALFLAARGFYRAVLREFVDGSDQPPV
jgi:hypothetical protein